MGKSVMNINNIVPIRLQRQKKVTGSHYRYTQPHYCDMEKIAKLVDSRRFWNRAIAALL